MWYRFCFGVWRGRCWQWGFETEEINILQFLWHAILRSFFPFRHSPRWIRVFLRQYLVRVWNTPCKTAPRTERSCSLFLFIDFEHRRAIFVFPLCRQYTSTVPYFSLSFFYSHLRTIKLPNRSTRKLQPPSSVTKRISLIRTYQLLRSGKTRPAFCNIKRDFTA